MKIRIILTGGTFEKEYDELAGTLTFRKTHLPNIMEQARCTVPVELEKMELIDSLHMNPGHRQLILGSCLASAEENIIIVHGTDTMVETAKVLGEAFKKGSEGGLSGKTIVLTGAMVPYTIAGSDAVFNLGCSITGVQLLPPGVFIIMNGKTFSWDRVIKNREKGVFEETRT